MLRIGFVDCDTSHVYAFAQRLNHQGIEPEQWVDGANVILAYAGASRIVASEQIDEYVAKMRATGVDLVEQPTDLIGRVDAAMVTSNEGGVHRQRATPLLEAGIPLYVNKPFTSSVADAKALVELAARRNVPLISASALRFADEITRTRNDSSLGPIAGVDVYTPAHLHDADPGLFHYGVHGVEMVYALMGMGCREVACHFEEASEVVVGRWSDGRLATIRGLRGATTGYGFTVYGEKAIRSESIATGTIYRNLLASVIPVLSGAPSPISTEELIEVVAFQEAALTSRQSGGQPVPLPL